MLKEFAWDIFEETGALEAYILYKELRGFEESQGTEEKDDRVCQDVWSGN